MDLTYKTLEIDDDHVWKLCVIYTNKSKTTVAASSLVDFNYMTGIARTKEVCVGIHNHGYCKTLLNMIINHIIANEPKIHKITTYCEHANIFACKCYRSVYSSLNPTITYDPHKGTTTYMYTRPQLQLQLESRSGTKRGVPTTASSSPSIVKRLRGHIGGVMTTTPDNKYTLQKISRVNGDDVYQVHEIESGCLFHFYKRHSTHVYINGKYLLPLSTNPGQGPGQTDNRDKLLAFLSTKPTMRQMKKRGIQSVSFKDCMPPINLDDAQNVIHKLNRKLIARCPHLYLVLDYMYNMSGSVLSYNNNPNTLLLCLCMKGINKCISSVELIVKNGVITVNSKTVPEHSSKKYNKLLRGYTVLVAKALKCTAIRSEAMNPISAWLLINYYNAVIPDTAQNEHFNKFAEKRPITKELIKDYERSLEHDYRHVFEMGLVINVTDPATIKRAAATVSEVLDEVIC